MKKKLALRILLVILISVAIECVCFQGKAVLKLLRSDGTANARYTLEDMEHANWEETEAGALLSQADPMLFLKLSGGFVSDIQICADADAPIPYVDLFYVNDQYINYGDQYLHSEDVQDNRLLLSIGDDVESLRLDLGDDAGLLLRDVEITVNPAEFRPSLSRIVAINLIYWGAKGLFRLQAMPDYGIESQLKKKEEEET